ncbi:MAG TPA: CCA tRNA nucleotidyltransferase [Xanthobacteraceae bacterium]|nr:CCA tRNA nucleotidyltransferase [Xanthobacteraceae bacterium]
MTSVSDVARFLRLSEEPLARVLALLDSDGEQARVIGGAVRNAMMGLPVGEVDLATTAVPDEVIRRFTAAGIKTVPTGIEHGTVTVVTHGVPFEVTTLREDVETYGRKAKVAFGRDWRKDAERRDFTINALSVSRDGEVHDYTGGIPDIAARKVQFIGDPASRIAEDYLRILRFFRFHAAYGEGELDPAGLHACIVAREKLDTLSRERVRMELMKLLGAPRAAATLTVMAEAGILQNVLGGVPRVASFTRMTANEAAAGLPRDPVRGLAALAVAVTEDADRLGQRLRLANVELSRLQSMSVGWWRIAAPVKDNAARALLYRLGPDAFADLVLLAWANSSPSTDDPQWRTLITLPGRWQAPVFPLKAADFMARGVEKGPALGAAIRTAEEAWIAADFPADAVAIAKILEDTTKS